MVAHGEESTKTTRLQAGSSEADNLLYSINIRVAHNIGRQLAWIGDQLDQQMGGSHLPVWFRHHPEGFQLGRDARYRAPVAQRWELNAVSRVIRGHLAHFTCRQAGDGWRTRVSPVQRCQPHWTAGLLAFTLAATVAYLIYR